MRKNKSIWYFMILFAMANQENFVNLSFMQANLNKSLVALSDLEYNFNLWSGPETRNVIQPHFALLQEPHDSIVKYTSGV